MLTESHLSESNTEAETFLPGWQQLRSDRKSRQKGGAIIYVRDQFTLEDTLTFSNNYVEIICTFIPSQDLALITLYRPPATPACKFLEAIEVVSDWIDKVETKAGKSPNIFATGDFNFPGMCSWTPSDMDAAVTKADHKNHQCW